MSSRLNQRLRESAEWRRLIPDDEWRIYETVIDRASAAGVELALGGAFAVAAFTGFWRNTKDIDLYIQSKDRETMIGILDEVGMRDYFDTLPYDRAWIYRACKDSTIVDVIWAMANHHSKVDRLWLSGPAIEIQGRSIKVIPVEAMVFDKLYIIQRERCDWPDVLNLLYWTAADLDWDTILDRLGPDWPLLAGALSIFQWVSPARAASVPEFVWRLVGLPAPDPV